MAQRGGRRRSGGTRKSNGRAPGGRRSPVDHHEVDWQFYAADLEPVEAWLRQHSSKSGLVVEPESEVEITDTYYDAEDWRFYRAGYALSVRKAESGAEATMKSISPAEGNIRRRREITEPLSDDKPATLARAPGPVGERARSLLGGRDARPMFGVRTRRQKFALLLENTADGSGNGSSANQVRIGEVLLDASEIPLGGGRESARLRRVEVEAGAGTAPTPALQGFVDEMQYALELKPASLSKFETGLYATGLSPRADTEAGPTEIGPDMTLGEVAFAVLRRQFAEMRAHEPGTRIGEDPDDFHDLRKKGKRLSYALEFVSEGYGKPVADLVLPPKALQDDLGDHQDAVVAAETLRELGTATGGPRVSRGAAFTMGVFSERCLREAAEVRPAVLRSKPFRALVKGRNWKDFEKAMKDAAKDPQKVTGPEKVAR